MDDVFFAMPLQDGQMTSGEWSDGISSDATYKPNQAISNNLAGVDVTEQERVFRIMLQIKGILNNARMRVPYSYQ